MGLINRVLDISFSYLYDKHIIDTVARFISSHRNDDVNDQIQPSITNEVDLCLILDVGLGDFLLAAKCIEYIINHYLRNGQSVWIVLLNPNCVSFIPMMQIDKNSDKLSIMAKTDFLVSCPYTHFKKTVSPVCSISPGLADLFSQVNSDEIIVENNDYGSIYGYSWKAYKIVAKVRITGKGNFYLYSHELLVDRLTGHMPHNELITLRANTFDSTVRKYYLINLSASNKTKEWPFVYVIRLIDLIGTEMGLYPVVIGKCNEEEAQMLVSAGADCSFLNKENLQNTIDLCYNSAFVLTPDTGVFHVAAIVGQGAVFVLCERKESLFAPYPKELERTQIIYIYPEYYCEICNHKLSCLRKVKANCEYADCMYTLTPEKVFKVIKYSQTCS